MPAVPGSFCTDCSAEDRVLPFRKWNHNLQSHFTKGNSHFPHNSQRNIKYNVPSRCTSLIVSEFTKTYAGSFVIEGESSAMSTLKDKCRMKLDMVYIHILKKVLTVGYLNFLHITLSNQLESTRIGTPQSWYTSHVS